MMRKYASGSVVEDTALGERQIRVVASDPTPDRDKDVMVPDGVDLANYSRNNVVLADHDPTKPIGNAIVEVKNGRVEALVEFAPPGVSAKADEYCGLAKAGVLKTVSVGFRPVASTPIKGGGLRYDKWELMELSLVAVPANPNAVVIARAAPEGEKTRPALKVGASRNLPIGKAAFKSGASAAQSIFHFCGFDGIDPDTNFARKGFLVYDPANPADKSAYRFPFASIVGGRLTADPAGIRAAKAALSTSDLPDDVAAKARAVLDHYEAQMKTTGSAPKIKGLYDVAQLAYCLSQLGYLHDGAVWEAEYEGDNSKVPGMLADALRALADAFVAMSQEEVSELLAGRDINVADDDDAEIAAAPTPLAKAYVKAGRVLSAANAEHINTVCKTVAELAKSHAKAADLRDDLHSTLEEMQTQIETIGKSARAISDSASPPAEDDTADEPDKELAAAAARRKRAIEILALELPAV